MFARDRIHKGLNCSLPLIIALGCLDVVGDVEPSAARLCGLRYVCKALGLYRAKDALLDAVATLAHGADNNSSCALAPLELDVASTSREGWNAFCSKN